MQITICDDTERAGNLDYIAGLVNSCKTYLHKRRRTVYQRFFRECGIVKTQAFMTIAVQKTL